MDMQDKEIEFKNKNEILNKAVNYCLIFLLLNIFVSPLLGIPIMVQSILSLICSGFFYSCWLFRYKFKFDKFHIGLVLMAITCIVLNIINLKFYNEYLGIIIMLFIYGYYMYGQKLVYGKISKVLIVFCIVLTATSLLNIFFDSIFISVLGLVVNISMILRMFNGTFQRMGEKKREKVNASGFTEEDAKKVPWIRKILFGRTGKLDLSILELFIQKK